jgi:hypothetical protein
VSPTFPNLHLPYTYFLCGIHDTVRLQVVGRRKLFRPM